MVIKACQNCEFHEIRDGEDGPMSHCGKENCWSRFSKCVARKALQRFLEQEAAERERTINMAQISADFRR